MFNKIELINYRVTRAKESIRDAMAALENNSLHMAENRIYYSAFYIISALALKEGFPTKKHSQLIGWFNKNFIKSKIIDSRYGKILQRINKNRLAGDYDDFITFEINQVKKDIDDVKDFVSVIEKLIY